MISFPRLQIRLLQCEEESDKKFDLFPQEDTDVLIYRSKADEAVARAYMCGMVLSSYDDKDVLQDICMSSKLLLLKMVKMKNVTRLWF